MVKSVIFGYRVVFTLLKLHIAVFYNCANYTCYVAEVINKIIPSKSLHGICRSYFTCRSHDMASVEVMTWHL